MLLNAEGLRHVFTDWLWPSSFLYWLMYAMCRGLLRAHRCLPHTAYLCYSRSYLLAFVEQRWGSNTFFLEFLCKFSRTRKGILACTANVTQGLWSRVRNWMQFFFGFFWISSWVVLQNELSCYKPLYSVVTPCQLVMLSSNLTALCLLLVAGLSDLPWPLRSRLWSPTTDTPCRRCVGGSQVRTSALNSPGFSNFTRTKRSGDCWGSHNLLD